MRFIPRLIFFSLVPGIACVSLAAAVCEATAEVRQDLRRLDVKDLNGEKRKEAQRSIVQELLAKYPDDLFVHLRYQRIMRGDTKAERKVLIERYRALAEKHAGDINYQFLHAKALAGVDTPQAIERLKTILTGQPSYPWAHFQLADIYSWGKFSDKPQSRKELDAFLDACPASLNEEALNLLERSATAEMAAKYAKPLRERLAGETDPSRERGWQTVWNLEFKARPPSEHDQVRKQLAADLGRLEQGPQENGAEWIEFLRSGHKLLGDDKAVAWLDERLIKEFPTSSEANEAARERWQKEHPSPQPDDTEEKKQAYYRAEIQMADDGLKRSPGEFEYLVNRFDALKELKDSLPEQIASAGDAVLEGFRQKPGWSFLPPLEFRVARALLKKKIRADRVPMLVEEGWKTYHTERNQFHSDREPDEMEKFRTDNDSFMKYETAEILLDAAEQLHKPEIARAAVAEAEKSKPEKAYEKSRLWTIKAKHAELGGRKLDALLMYRTALDTRPARNKPSDKDELAENFDRLWKELGGTDASRTLLRQQAKQIEAAEEGRWEKPSKALPPWELSDLEGKTWKLVSLEGKSVLINVWATWCGPCREEHPHLQKLYDKLKGKASIQVLTFNVDDEVGNVAPYIKEKGYTFPVVLAKNYVDELLPVLSIPRNWIVDPQGKWQWEQIGFGSDAKWEEDMLSKLDSPASK